MNLVGRLFKEEEGQALTEYGLILGIVAVAVIAVLGLMRDELVDIFEAITAALTI